MNRLDDSEDDIEVSNRPNKSALKREAQALVELGIKLAALSPEIWTELNLEEGLLDALALYNRIEAHGAKARQRARIGKLLRKMDTGPIEAALLAKELEKSVQTRDFHKIETWRDRLLSEGPAALDDWMTLHPQSPREQFLKVLQHYNAGINPRQKTQASRDLFRLLRDHLPK